MTLTQMEAVTGLQARPLDTLPDQLAKDAGLVQLRVIRNVDSCVQAAVEKVRQEAGLP